MKSQLNWIQVVIFVATLGLAPFAQAQPENSAPGGGDSQKANLTQWLKEKAGISGSLRGAYFDRDKSFSSDRGFAVGGLWLQARPEEFWGVKAFFDGRIQGENLNRNDRSVGDVREAYIEASHGSWDFKVGRQINVWGRADKINPTDVWSVRDFTLLSVDDEDQRTGLFATQVVYNFENNRLIALWQPEWRNPVFPLNVPGNVRLRQGIPKARQDQWGLKWDHTGGDWDYSLSYSKALDRVPGLQLISAGAGGVDLQFRYTPIEVWGADLASTFGSYGFRGEVARIQTKDDNGKNPLIRNSQIFAVLGVDRTFFSDLNINIQYVYRRNENFQSLDQIADSNLRFLAEQVGIISWGLSEEVHNGSIRMSYKAFNDTLETELALVGWLNNGLMRPRLSYAISDHLKVTVGAELYGGESDSFFGRLKETSTGFAELRYLF